MALAAKASMEATADDTRFLCTRSATDYNSKHIDIDVKDSKTITKQKEPIMYISKRCLIGEIDIPQFKKQINK